MRTRSVRMDELREAVQALAEEAQALERQMAAMDDVPSHGHLDVLQKSADRIQHGLNPMQTAMDVCACAASRDGLVITPPALPLSAMVRRSASMRLTTLAGRAGAFSVGAGTPACFERISSIIAFS